MPRIQSIQVMRGVAALAVVVFHLFEYMKPYTTTDVNRLTGRYHIVGLIGVDLFFCISGFIMLAVLTRTGEGSSRRLFLSKRLVRIVPAYWLLTGVMLAAHAVQALHSPGFAFSAAATVLRSFLFVPVENAAGDLAPVLAPGWTLSFEMFFYLVLLAVVPWTAERIVAFTAALFGGLVLIGAAAVPAGPVLRVVTSPLLLEFVFGMLVFLQLRHSPRPSTVLAVACCAAGVAVIGLTHAAVLHGDWHRLAIRGVPAGLLLLGVLHLAPSSRVWRWRPLLLLGDASYSLYLTHAIVLPLCLRACFGVPHLPLAAVAAASLAVTLLAALAFYQLVERPVHERLGGWVGRPLATRGAPLAVTVSR